MKKLLYSSMAVIIFLLMVNGAQAGVVEIAHDWPVMSITDGGGYLTGILQVGDTVHVEAFYDPAAATLIPAISDSSIAYYSFPAGSAGETFTVNGYKWTVTGPLVVAECPIAVTFIALGLSYGGPEWLGEAPETAGFVTSTISTPIHVNGSDKQGMYFLPMFPEGTFPGTNLPTSISEAQIATIQNDYEFFDGSVWDQNASDTGYWFDFGNPVTTAPTPPTFLLLGSGLIGLVGWRRFRKS